MKNRSTNAAEAGAVNLRTPSAGLLVALALVCQTCSVFGAAEQAREVAPQAAPPAGAEKPASELTVPACLVRIHLPIEGSADQRYLGLLEQAVAKLTEQAPPNKRGVLVLHLMPSNAQPDGRGVEFERALSLARFLTSEAASRVKTIAFVPQTIRGHGVLLALACEEIAMAPQAELGEAGIDEDSTRPIEPGLRSLYQQVAEGRRTIPQAIALGMVDPASEVLRVETEDRIEFVLADQIQELEKTNTIISQEPLAPRGSMVVVTGRLGRELGFVKYLAGDTAELSMALRLPPGTLDADQSVLEDWRGVVIDLDGPVTRRLGKRVQNLIASELDQGRANWICLRIDSSGGELAEAIQLAATIAELDPTEVRTIAYVPRGATGVAAVVALACDQLVLQPGCEFGAAADDALAAPRQERPFMLRRERAQQQRAEEETRAAVAALRSGIAAKAERTWSLLAATLDPQIELFHFSHRETGQTRLFCEEEAAEQPDAASWRRGEPIAKPGAPLGISPERAVELGVAWRSVESIDELAQLFGLSVPLRVAKPNWALEFVEALASPGLTALLLVIAFVGVYIELHTPGVGVGGFVSAVAIMLFFWSKYLDGTAQWLEVLLFVMGLFFVLLELFVLPGVGIFGLGGGAMMLVALVLMSQTFVLPQTASQLGELRSSMSSIAAAGMGAAAIAFALRQYLPHSPMFRRMLLQPPQAEELAEIDHRELQADYSHLIGATGIATTNLMPTGRVDIGGELIDVIAEEGVIDRGHRVEVVAARANRVIVKRVG